MQKERRALPPVIANSARQPGYDGSAILAVQASRLRFRKPLRQRNLIA
jgi:hypothetical protein